MESVGSGAEPHQNQRASEAVFKLWPQRTYGGLILAAARCQTQKAGDVF